MKVRLSETQTTNKCLFKENKKILKSTFDLENNKKLNTEEVIIFDKKKDYELVKALQDALLTSSLFKIDAETTFHIQLSVRLNDQHKADLDQNNKQISCKICSQETEDQNERLKNFDMKKITSIFNRIFAAE